MSQRLARLAAHVAGPPVAPATVVAASEKQNKKKVLLVGIMHPEGPRLLESRDDVELVRIQHAADGRPLTAEERVAHMQAEIVDADAVVMRVTPLTAETIALAKRLKVVGGEKEVGGSRTFRGRRASGPLL
jgi:hypothetical protein